MNNTNVAIKFASKKPAKGINLFTDGKIIYSYGYHFAIAKHLNDNIVLFNNLSYSNSTSKHQNYVNYAIYRDFKIVYCYDVENFEKHSLIAERKIISLIDKLKKAKKPSLYISQIESIILLHKTYRDLLSKKDISTFVNLYACCNDITYLNKFTTKLA